MAYHFIPKGGICFTITVALLLLPQLTVAQDDPPNLFQYAAAVDIEGERNDRLLDPRSQDQYDLYQQAPTTAQLALVYVDLAALRLADSVTLNLEFQQEATSDLLDSVRIDDRAPGEYSWFGAVSSLTGNTTNAIMVVAGTQVVGTIHRGPDLYQIRPLNNGAHALIYVDQSNVPVDHPPEFDDEFQPNEEDAPRLSDQPTGSIFPHFVHPTDGGELDCKDFTVLVAYTPAAKADAAAQGGIDSLIQLAIDETNQGYRNSYVNIQVQLVHKHEVTYSESGSMQVDRDRFRINGDEVMDDVHALRNTHAADIAILITDRDIYCGSASAIGASEDTAFAVVAVNCATGYFVRP